MKKANANSVDSYIASYPEDVRVRLTAIRETVKKIAGAADEEIVYSIPTFRVKGKNLLHYAAFRSHIGIYPGPSAIEHFRDRLAGYKLSKGTIQLPLDQELPLELIEDIVRYRLENL